MKRTDAEIKEQGKKLGYLINSTVIQREDEDAEVLIWKHSEGPLKGAVTCHLDGYAIVPEKEYKRLLSLPSAYRKALEAIEVGCSFPSDSVQKAIRDRARQALSARPEVKEVTREEIFRMYRCNVYLDILDDEVLEAMVTDLLTTFRVEKR